MGVSKTEKEGHTLCFGSKDKMENLKEVDGARNGHGRVTKTDLVGCEEHHGERQDQEIMHEEATLEEQQDE